MTSHDREFMNRIVSKIVEIDGGSLTTYSGDYEFYEQQRALNEKQQQAQFERQQAMLAKEIKFIERFKARASHAAQVQSRVKKLDKIERVEPPRRRQTVAFEFPPAPRSGDDVVEPQERRTRAMARAADLRGARFPGAPQGALVRDGRQRRRQIDAAEAGGGRDRAGRGHGRASAPASRWAISPSTRWICWTATRTVFESLEDAFPQAGQGSLRTLAGCFGFSGDDVEKKCRVLSGGEKARLVMAMMLFDPPNFLVLDEPTNHLDMATKEMLIAALSQYEGTMLFVSHDRHFLAALSNRVLELTPEGVHNMAAATPNMSRAPARRRPACIAEPAARAAARARPFRRAPRGGGGVETGERLKE